jgi:hypothetical protein
MRDVHTTSKTGAAVRAVCTITNELRVIYNTMIAQRTESKYKWSCCRSRDERSQQAGGRDEFAHLS